MESHEQPAVAVDPGMHEKTVTSYLAQRLRNIGSYDWALVVITLSIACVAPALLSLLISDMAARTCTFCDLMSIGQAPEGNADGANLISLILPGGALLAVSYLSVILASPRAEQDRFVFLSRGVWVVLLVSCAFIARGIIHPAT
jgi:hypothetical protein